MVDVSMPITYPKIVNNNTILMVNTDKNDSYNINLSQLNVAVVKWLVHMIQKNLNEEFSWEELHMHACMHTCMGNSSHEALQSDFYDILKSMLQIFTSPDKNTI